MHSFGFRMRETKEIKKSALEIQAEEWLNSMTEEQIEEMKRDLDRPILEVIEEHKMMQA